MIILVNYLSACVIAVHNSSLLCQSQPEIPGANTMQPTTCICIHCYLAMDLLLSLLFISLNSKIFNSVVYLAAINVCERSHRVNIFSICFTPYCYDAGFEINILDFHCLEYV